MQGGRRQARHRLPPQARRSSAAVTGQCDRPGRPHPLLRKVGLRRIRFHDFRHPTAVLLLEQSGYLVVIKEFLGHAHIGVTADVYAHVRLRLQQSAVTTLSDVLHPQLP
ncbi:tyrosine-type recombinase/integrase [Streptomyces sp. H51]|uniref:tyrosine-type recombinase/integrase n=1 Tax=Streptomyces sp. H51 TaxID=3111770 RepID=UPI003B6345B6